MNHAGTVPEFSGDKVYSGQGRDVQAQELLAQLIGKRGEEALRNETNKTVVEKIKSWLVEFWNTFGKALGLKDITPEEAAKMTVEDVADAIRAEMLSGRRYGERLERVEFAEGGARTATRPVRLKRRLTGRQKAVNDFVAKMGGAEDPTNVETDMLSLWVDNGGRLFDKMPFEVSTGYSKGKTGVKKTRSAVADEFAESTAFYQGLSQAQRKVFFGTEKLESGSIGESLREKLEAAGITRFTREDGTVDYEAAIEEFQRQWTNYERGAEFLKERGEYEEARDRAYVEEMERAEAAEREAERAAMDEISAEEAAARDEAAKSGMMFSRAVVDGKETAVATGHPLSIREARDPDKVLKILSPLVGKSAAQIGEMKLTRINVESMEHSLNSDHARKLRIDSSRKGKRIWRGRVGGLSVLDDIIATSGLGEAENPKHFNREWKKDAKFYRAETRFAIETEKGYEVYPCKLLVAELKNGERFVYDLTEIKEPTLSASAGKASLALAHGRTGESAPSPTLAHESPKGEALEVAKAGSILAPKDSKSQAESPALPSRANIIANPSEGAQGGRKLLFSRSGIFTGSGADYEKPSLQKVGTGEGSQVYGWGLYGSTVRGVAEKYAKLGELKDKIYKNGKEIKYANFITNAGNIESKAALAISLHKGDIKTAIRKLESKANWPKNPDDIKQRKAVLAELKQHGSEYRLETFSDHLYEQTWFTNREPGDESHLLKWYEPISKETWDIIREGIKAIGDTYEESYIDRRGNSKHTELFWKQGHLLERDGKPVYPDTKGSTGQSFYKDLAMVLGSPKAASEYLAKIGIDGVKYPVDSYGKTVKDGDKAGWNYVSFRDDNIRVDHKWRDGQLLFSRATLKNGRDYVHVDVEQKQFDAKTPSEQQRIAKRVILKKFKGKVIGEDGARAFVTKDSAGEYAYPAKRIKGYVHEAKMRTSPELDTLLSTAQFKGHNADDGRHPNAKGGWDHYDAIFEVGGKYFRGDIALLVDAKGRRRLHDVTQIKEETLSQLLKSTQGRSASSGYSARKVLQGRNPGEGSSAADIIANPSEGEQGGRKLLFSRSGIFTGSGADYEKPSLQKVGTGEGSQVYGWGLYGSTVRGIAEGYAKEGRSGESIAWRMFKAEGRTKAIRTMKDGLRKGYYTGNHAKWIPEAIKILEEHREKPPSQHLYEQTFFTDRAPGDESHLLKWYEPISKETWDIIREGVKAIGDTYEESYIDRRDNSKHTELFWKQGHLLERNGKPVYPGSTTGQSFYKDLAIVLGSPKAASEYLAKIGIDGVKYPVDSYGKTVKDGDKAGWNYVSFRDDNMRVDHKWRDGQLLFSRAVKPSALGDGKQRYYEVKFEDAVDKIVANRRKNGTNATAISRDYVFVGETPDALEDIGFVKLPIMMTQHHIETCYFSDAKGKAWGISGNMHGLGNTLKRIPAALQKPVMVIASKSPTGKDTSVVAITSVSTPDGDMILPIVINGEPNVDGNQITAHVMTSAHGRKNAWTGLVSEALDAEQKGNVGIFYMDKAKASKVFTKLAQANPKLARVGLMYAKDTQSDGTLHSIADADSPVKGQAGIVKSQTATRQFKNWFNESKVVDANGEPLVVYHGTEKKFWAFSNQQIGNHTDAGHEGGVGLWGRGHYFTSNRSVAEGYVRGNPDGRTMAVYLNIRNPMGREEIVRIGAEAARITEDKPEDFYREYQRLIDESVRKNGYDGAIVNNKYSTEYVVFEPNQIKSATDNIGTFDAGNSDIRFSRKGGAAASGRAQDRGSVGPSALGDGKQRYYEVPFDKAVDKIVKNKKPVSDEHVFISETPDVFREIGLPSLPVMMNQSHVLSCYFGQGEGVKAGNMHGLGAKLKSLPKAIAKPMMVISNDSNPSSSVIAIVKMQDRDGHTVIAPVEINGIGRSNAGPITANIVKSAFGKKNLWSEKVAKALRDEVDGKVAVFYIDSNEARQISNRLAREAFNFGKSERQLLSVTKGTVHSIADFGSPVKGVGAQKDSRQFKRWFDGSKVVDANGEPLVVWHGTDGNFTEFKQEEMREREGSFFFAENREDAKAYSGSGKVMPVYVNLRKPFDYENGTVPEAYKERWRNVKDKREQVAILKELGYDGWLANFENGKGWGEISAFYPNQIKSATDNIGSFDPGNNDIRFSRGGGPQAENVKLTRIADDAGTGEQTPGALAASRELSRQGATPLTTRGTRYVSLPASEMHALLRFLGGHAEMVEGSKLGAAGNASVKRRKLQIAADLVGTVDKSDLAAEKAQLRQRGYFANEDPTWLATHSQAEARAERERGETALASRLEALSDRRVRGAEPGGMAAGRRVFADQLAKIVMAMPHGQPGPCGDSPRLCRAIYHTLPSNLPHFAGQSTALCRAIANAGTGLALAPALLREVAALPRLPGLDYRLEHFGACDAPLLQPGTVPVEHGFVAQLGAQAHAKVPVVMRLTPDRHCRLDLFFGVLAPSSASATRCRELKKGKRNIPPNPL